MVPYSQIYSIDTIDVDFNCENDHESSENLNDSFESMDETLDIELAIAEYITKANLDKSKTSELIQLLNYIHSSEKPPPLSTNTLWSRLNIQFNYHLIQYCTNCMSKLTDQSVCCNKSRNRISSELIVFPIGEEIKCVVINNYGIMSYYKSNIDALMMMI